MCFDVYLFTMDNNVSLKTFFGKLSERLRCKVTFTTIASNLSDDDNGQWDLLFCLKGQYHGRSMGDIMIFGQNSLNLNFEHCVN